MADNEGGSGFLWFLAGLGIGAAIGILYAPKPGDEMRQQILDAAGQGRDAVAERARQMKEQANTWVDKGRDYVQQQRENVRSAVDAGRQAYREATTAPDANTSSNL